MKELSIEEKAKAYDEAIERAKKWRNAPNVNKIPTFGNRVIEEIFPELIESEDEWIRKELMQNLKERFGTRGSMGKNLDMPRVLAWLKKQGEKKETLCDKCKKAQPSHSCQDITALGRCALEKHGEQKPADKIEPTFKIGDIITNGKIIGKVDENDNNKYHGWFGYDKDLSVHYADIPDIENWHKWTIQDAKDGDVLVTNSNIIFIFKYLDEGGTIAFRASCTENSGVYFHKIKDRLCDQDVHPATKEQRDLLFQKMKEAGYEWDAELKQLRKIENEIEIPFGAKDSELQEVTYYIPKGFRAEINDDKVIIKKGENPIAWSEEDERMYRGLHNLIYSTPYCDSRKELSDWLESLKERVQPKQEWSEDDERGRKQVVDLLEGWLSTFKETCYAEDCKCGIAWLKSLRPQTTWKPSDEQMKALAESLSLAKNCGEECAFDLRTLYEQLKKLMED